jgi:hypothetical protein
VAVWLIVFELLCLAFVSPRFGSSERPQGESGGEHAKLYIEDISLAQTVSLGPVRICNRFVFLFGE